MGRPGSQLQLIQRKPTSIREMRLWGQEEGYFRKRNNEALLKLHIGAIEQGGFPNPAFLKKPDWLESNK